LELLATVFEVVISVIVRRHGSTNAPTNRRLFMSVDARSTMQQLIKHTRLHQVFEWTRLARCGLLPASISSLNQSIALCTRFGSTASSIGMDALNKSIHSLSSQELFLLLEYVDGTLRQCTKDNHPDIKELKAKWEEEQRRKEEQAKMFRGVPLTSSSSSSSNNKQETATAHAGSDESGSGGGGGKKKQKKKQLLLF